MICVSCGKELDPFKKHACHWRHEAGKLAADRAARDQHDRKHSFAVRLAEGFRIMKMSGDR